MVENARTLGRAQLDAQAALLTATQAVTTALGTLQTSITDMQTKLAALHALGTGSGTGIITDEHA